MKRILNNKLLIYIPLLIIMLISFLNMQNAKLLSYVYNNHLIKQVLWYIIGFILLIIIQKLNIKSIFKYSKYLYYFSLLLLLFVLIFGKSINGAKAWFNLGMFSFQPSEFVKFTLTLYLSNIISNYKKNNIKDEIKLIIKVFVITIIPSILVFLEPDTGAIIFYLIIALSLLYSIDIKKIWFIILGLLLIIFIGIFISLYIYNQDLLINLIGTSFFYRVERLITFTTASSYQLDNALIAIGSATILGTGINKISLYIPEAPTDFIFAFNISNFGIISGFIVILCFILMDIYLINRLFNLKSKKIKLFLSSFISIFLFQEIINIGMNIGLIPIIGIPLPFLSYGGSTIIIYFLFLSIILKTNNNMGMDDNNYKMNGNMVHHNKV